MATSIIIYIVHVQCFYEKPDSKLNKKFIVKNEFVINSDILYIQLLPYLYIVHVILITNQHYGQAMMMKRSP